ncbi:MAG: hypothetical protein HY822_13235 [Acidobacteria bacterium]|nr:hypothetical protein [Acidobacteriota bacterium]
MLGICPACKSRNVRLAHARGSLERVGGLLGFTPFRCRDCHHRFLQSIWGFRTILYARCPRCDRLDLSSWSESHYNLRWTMRLKLLLGARKYRCEPCRCNFASFRRLKQRYRPPRFRPANS